MNTRKEFQHHPERKHARRQDLDDDGDSDDFNSRRMSNKLKIKARRESGNRPVGNYEYEQMIAEDVGFGVHHMIEEAAFFIAMRRGFAPGDELGDWLQAEKDIDSLLHGTAGENGTVPVDNYVMKPLRERISG